MFTLLWHFLDQSKINQKWSIVFWGLFGLFYSAIYGFQHLFLERIRFRTSVHFIIFGIGMDFADAVAK